MSDLSLEEFYELKIKFSLSIGYAGASRKDEEYLSNYVDYEDWIILSEDHKQYLIDVFANEWSCNYIDLAGWVE